MYILMPETEGFKFDCRGDETKEKITVKYLHFIFCI